MTTNNYLFKGKAKWARVREPDPEYSVYKIDLFMDDDSWKEFKKSGCQLKTRTADEGDYITFKKKAKDLDFDKTPPVLVDVEGPTVYLKDAQSGEYILWPEGLIGNGSTVQLSVEVFDTDNGKGHRLNRVWIDDLVKYEPKDKTDPESAKLPF